MNDKELFTRYIDKVDSIKDQRYLAMQEDIYNGQTSYLRMKFKGSSVFNPEWIYRIEDCLYELDQITNNPREVTAVEGSVMPIELAKKINYESVQHLASHSQFIKDITDTGDVIPAKILGLYNKEELHTYENRFIATFIRRLILFIDKRYEFIKNTVNLDEKEIMYVKNKSIIDGQEVEVETKISVTRTLEDDLTVAARDYIERIKNIKEYVGYYYNSPFMKEFKTEKDVRRPILLTNIIKKNPLYRKCYETFLFIEKFDSLGVTFKVDRNFQDFSEKERQNITRVLLPNLLYLENTESSKVYKESSKVYKPKLLPSIDDESFLYDNLVKGPVEFVRADENYLNYLKQRSPEYLPEHPNNSEKEYYKDLYNLKRQMHLESANIDALLARIRREIEHYEKKVERLIETRNKEEAKAYQRLLQDLRAYEQDVLNKKREEIIAAARLQREENEKYAEEHKDEEKENITAKIAQNTEKQEEKEEEPVVEEPIVEEPEVEESEPEESPIEEPAKEEIPTFNLAQEYEDVPTVELAPEEPEEPPYIDENDLWYVVDSDHPLPPIQRAVYQEPEAPTQYAPIQEEPTTKYVVRNKHGYYLTRNTITIFLNQAKVFYSEADAIKAMNQMKGGRVVKL